MDECQQFQLFVHAFVDGEFDEAERIAAHRHLAVCTECRDLARHHALFKEELQRAYGHEAAPLALKERLAEQLRQRAASLTTETPRPSRWASVHWEWIAGPALASAAAAAFVLLAVTPPAEKTPTKTPAVRLNHMVRDGDPIVAEAVTWHRRSVPVEVVGPNRRRVGRWFDGKVPFPVRLPKFDPHGTRGGDVNLLGARLSNVAQREAAYVIYEVDGSKVSMLVFDGSQDHRGRTKTSATGEDRSIRFQNAGGYNVAVVEDNGVTYSITSELPQRDMAELVEAAFHP